MKEINHYVLPLVATSWYSLGLELLDREHEKSLEIIEENNKHDVESCCRKMFVKWLETSESSTCTWEQLIDAIKRIDLIKAAEKIELLLQQGNLMLYHKSYSRVVVLYIGIMRVAPKYHPKTSLTFTL